ncbi:MAG: xanthine dehydrogenase family protein subunit M [Rhizobiales bacterium]|nr:xanthine dehydrogenase family protein subunit M [Hyphomicrobiales bacterium]
MTLPQNQSPAEFEYYVNATSIEEACRALGDGTGTILAGGSDLWVQKDEGVKTFGPRLINISRLEELAEISIGNDQVRLGARVTMTDILCNNELGKIAPGLAEAANRFASSQIRNVATIGGNFANASPAADAVIPLLCLDAEIELARLDGNAVATRSIPAVDFFTGPGKSVRAADELITAISFKPRDGKSLARFFKSGPRPALEISIVSLGIVADISDGKLSNVRIALGAVAPIPFRARKTEALIEGQKIDDNLIAAATDYLAEEISPIGDVRGSAWYRRHLARTYLQEALTNVA